MSKLVKINGHIYAEQFEWEDEYRFRFYSFDAEKVDCLKVAPYTIEIELPDDLDLTSKQLTALQEKRKLILAENEIRLQKVDEKIQNLLALENHAEVQS